MTSFLKDDLVWVPCNIDGYKLMKVENVDIVGGKLLVKDHKIDDVNCGLNRSESVSIGLCSKYVSDTDKDDNTSLTSLDPANILENIRFRFAQGKIYTSTAHVLLAMNPYREITNLYSQETKRSYYGKHISQMPPHPYSIADSSYRSMVLDKKKHAIVISGESGAGKTETAKIVMSYLAEVGILPNRNELNESELEGLTDKQRKRLMQIRLSYSSNALYGEDESKKIQKRILSANPILEAFGNARTVRNYNSSRFGRLNKMYYNEHGFLEGGGITTYLLESSRCVKHNHNERSYHCFYQLIHGCSDRELKEYYLERNIYKYKLLNQGNLAYNSEIESDSEQFSILKESFGVNGINEDLQTSLFKILSGIILLGNVDFNSDNSNYDLNDSNSKSSLNDGKKLEFSDNTLIENISDLFSIENDLLSEVLLVKQLKIGNNQNSVTIPRTSHQSIQLIHSIIRSIYMRLFNWVVFQINKFTSCKKNDNLNSPSKGDDINNSLYIGILDIYGFEKLEINSFEQLCINLANEKLQEFFVEKVLQSEQRLYKQEGLIWTNIDIPKTQPVLDLIFDIFSLLDDDSRLKSQGQDRSDYTYWQRINNKYGKLMNSNSGTNNNNLSISSPSKYSNDRNLSSLQKLIKFPLNGLKMNTNELNTKFVIKHYAGSVEYTLNGWLDKNQDKIIPELEELLCNSKNSILNSIIDEEYKNRKSASFRSVSKKFTKDLKDMIQDLGEISLQFIRCFIPNSNMRQDEWNGHLVLNQMIQSGTIQMVKIMHYGYPNRASYSNLIKQLRYLLPERYIYGFSDRMIVEFFLSAYNIPSNTYQFGISKLFLKSGQYGLLLDQISDYTNGNYDNGLVIPDENVLIDLRRKFAKKCLRRCIIVADIVTWLKNRFIKLIRIRKKINMLLCNKIYRWYIFYRNIILPLRERVSNRMPYILCNKLLNKIIKSDNMRIKMFVFKLLKLNVQVYNKIRNNNNNENNKKVANVTKEYKDENYNGKIKKTSKLVKSDNISGICDNDRGNTRKKMNIFGEDSITTDQGLVGLEIWKQELFSFIGFKNSRKYNYIVHYDGNNVCLLEIYGEKVKTYELFIPMLNKNNISKYFDLDNIKFINTNNGINCELSQIEKDIKNINFNDDNYCSDENNSNNENSKSNYKYSESDGYTDNNTYYSEYRELDGDMNIKKVKYEIGSLLCLSQHPTFNTSFVLINDEGSISIFKLNIEIYSEEASSYFETNECGINDYWDIINSTPSTKLPNLGCDLNTMNDNGNTVDDQYNVVKHIKNGGDKSLFSLKNDSFNNNNLEFNVYTRENGERKIVEDIKTINICSNITFNEYMPSEWTENGDIFVPLRVHFIDPTSYQYLGILWHVEYSDYNIKRNISNNIDNVRLKYPESIRCFRSKKRIMSKNQYYNDLNDECGDNSVMNEGILIYDGLFTIIDLSTNEIIEWLNFPFKLSKIVKEWNNIGESDNNNLIWNKINSYHPKCWCNLFGFAMNENPVEKNDNMAAGKDGYDGNSCSSPLIYDVIPTVDVLKETCFISSEKMSIFKNGINNNIGVVSSSKEYNTTEEYLIFIGGPKLGLIISFEVQTQNNDELVESNMDILYDVLKLNNDIDSNNITDLVNISCLNNIKSDEFKNILENSTWFTTSLWVKDKNNYTTHLKSNRVDSSILMNARLSSTSFYSNIFGMDDVTLLLGAINGRIVSLSIRKKEIVKITLLSPFEFDNNKLSGNMRSSSIVSMFCMNDITSNKIACISSTGDMVTINLNNISSYNSINNNNNLIYSDKLHICLNKKYRPFIVQFLIFNSNTGSRNIIDSKLTQSFIFLDAVEKNLVIYNKNLGVTRPIATII
ncbi:hypothetical protein RS030_150 [Cryptosporidium xiaoi]|uniref:Myosin motor domain-containing protein n=1 Tax=Cryptosporidium xiaoi TaxID=659607 RepID=A0AAV9XY19_9CRYT